MFEIGILKSSNLKILLSKAISKKMERFEITRQNKVVRGVKRASYDKKVIFDILDAGMICHVGFTMHDSSHIIPTAYARSGETIYIHGSVKSRMIQEAVLNGMVSIAVTHLDGLVLARSAFHHSVNYRSAIIYGMARKVEDPTEKVEALKLITENILQGRWDEVRQPNQKELDITTVLAINIESASAKVRTGGPIDDEDDYRLSFWAGTIPFRTVLEAPVPDERLNSDIEISRAVALAYQDSRT